MIGIVNTGSGNVNIYKYIFDKLEYRYRLVEKPEDLDSVDSIFVPGVGAIDHSMTFLKTRELFDPLMEWLHADKPALCVCLGFQMLFESSEEGVSKGFGVLKGKVKRFSDRRIPRIEWGFVDWVGGFPSPNDPSDERFYFVHSFYAPLVDETICIANYGVDYSAGIRSGNIWGFQFHPEKSHHYGLNIIKEFLQRYETK